MSNNGKKSIEELKRDRKVLDRKAMDSVKGGKRRGSLLRRLSGNIIPQ